MSITVASALSGICQLCRTLWVGSLMALERHFEALCSQDGELPYSEYLDSGRAGLAFAKEFHFSAHVDTRRERL